MSPFTKETLFKYHNKFEAPEELISSAQSYVKKQILSELEKVLNTMGEIGKLDYANTIINAFINNGQQDKIEKLLLKWQKEITSESQPYYVELTENQ